MVKTIRLTRSSAITGTAILTILLLAIWIGLTPALGQDSMPSNAVKQPQEILPYIPNPITSCVPGPTGGCSVTFIRLFFRTTGEAYDACGERYCAARIEWRW